MAKKKRRKNPAEKYIAKAKKLKKTIKKLESICEKLAEESELEGFWEASRRLSDTVEGLDELD